MAAATILAQFKGTDFVLQNVYGSWWFSLLWGIGAAAGIAYFVKRKIRRAFIVVLHLSFVIILAGAFITHISARKGMIHLRQGQTVTSYTTENNTTLPLPFAIRLDKFTIAMHEGNAAAMDFASHVTIKKEAQTEEKVKISMNNIYNRHGIRLYQSSYDDDMKGSYLSVNTDPYGIPVTYAGYALLFISLIWMLTDRQGRFRKLLKSSVITKKAMTLLLLLSIAGSLQAQSVLPKETAEKFGRLFIVYNGRVCPIETFAIDFTKKLYGKARYKDFTPCQVLTGFFFYPREWMNEPVLKIKGKELQSRLNLRRYIAPARLFAHGEYLLGPYLYEAQTHNSRTGFYKEILDTDDKMLLLMNVSGAEVFRIFPFCQPDGSTQWYAPQEKQPVNMPKEQAVYVRSILSMAAQAANEKNFGMVNEILDKLSKYQYRYGGSSVPSHLKVWAEGVYNHIPFQTILFIVNLTLGFLSVLFLSQCRKFTVFRLLMAVSWLVLSVFFSLRWIISSTVPINNGYETMVFLAWLVLLITLISSLRIPIMATFGFLMSGFMLLVSHICQMDPAITPRMPVLNSPLLSIHVSVIMMSYALLSLTFIIAMAYFLTAHSTRKQVMLIHRQLTVISQLFLYPAITTMGLGIFIGAIWANISWGSYWSWDPKETWALITFMIYAVVLHPKSLPSLNKPKVYHLYMAIAFLSLIMTYFGVNYILGGMHSYA